VKHSLLILAVLAVIASPAAAQNTEIGAGFALQYSSWNGCCGKGLGIDFAQTVIKKDTWSGAVVADFSWLKFTEADYNEKDTTIVGGFRVKFLRHKRVSFFAQGTAGVMPWTDSEGDSAADLLIGGGGGLQVRLTDLIDARAQFDIWANKDLDWYWFDRFLFAIVFKLGKK